MMTVPNLLITRVDEFIKAQLVEYWPNRVKDYETGKLHVVIVVVTTQSQHDYFQDLKLAASIHDPACVLIVGFDNARLFLQPYQVDLEKR
jgi:hypothetical protein